MGDQTPPWREGLDTYRRFQKNEGIPVHTGLALEDVYSIDVDEWERTGGRGAFINLEGMEGTCDSQIHEIPEGEELREQRHLHEAMVYVVEGSGVTSIGVGEDRTTFEWSEGALFSLPRNTPYKHINAQGDQSVRLLVTTPLPLLHILHRDDELIWENETYDEWAKSRETKDFYKSAADASAKVWDDLIYFDANFISDARIFDKLESWPGRGGGGRSVFFPFEETSMFSHMSEFQSGGYKKAHRHLGSANILILEGEGFSLLWKELSDDRIRVDWKPGAFFTPPTMWFHQHFNTSEEPARYLVFHGPYKKMEVNDNERMNPLHPANQIEYHEENPEIREIFQQKLDESGVENQMDPTLYGE